jgi:hypothetical protein
LRDPEAEEHYVVSAIGSRREQVGLDEPDAGIGDPGRGDLEHFRRAVDRRDRRLLFAEDSFEP